MPTTASSGVTSVPTTATSPEVVTPRPDGVNAGSGAQPTLGSGVGHIADSEHDGKI